MIEIKGMLQIKEPQLRIPCYHVFIQPHFQNPYKAFGSLPGKKISITIDFTLCRSLEFISLRKAK